MSTLANVAQDFLDEEYRYAYAEDFLNSKIATQICVLREQRGWAQEDLAQKIGTKQSGISRLENVNYAAWNLETLKKIARAFGVILRCEFVAFSDFLAEEERFGRQDLECMSFEDEYRAEAVQPAQTTQPVQSVTPPLQPAQAEGAPENRSSGPVVPQTTLLTFTFPALLPLRHSGDIPSFHLGSYGASSGVDLEGNTPQSYVIHIPGKVIDFGMLDANPDRGNIRSISMEASGVFLRTNPYPWGTSAEHATPEGAVHG